MQVPGGELTCWRYGAGGGEHVLLLHGGPGMSCDYMEDVAEELVVEHDVVLYQQRGVPPSSPEGPFDIRTAVADAVAVLDALSWERGWVVGHSWGGHLLLHLMVSAAERVLGGLAVEPLGGVGDGGYGEFEAAMLARTPEADRARAEELDRLDMAGEATEEQATEALRLVWSAYFASPDRVAPFPVFRLSSVAYAALLEAVVVALPRLEAALGQVSAPFGCLSGAASPMPASSGAATARAIPGGWQEIVDGAGHIPWFERPGCVAAGLRRLIDPA